MHYTNGFISPLWLFILVAVLGTGSSFYFFNQKQPEISQKLELAEKEIVAKPTPSKITTSTSPIVQSTYSADNESASQPKTQPTVPVAPKPPIKQAAQPEAGTFEPQTKIEYYEISGTNSAELRQAMDTLGPTDKNGVHYDGYAKFYLTWKYDYYQTTEGCRARPIFVTGLTTITLPVWVNAAAAIPDLQTKWNNYVQALTTHENGHADSTNQEGRRLWEAILALGPYPSCSQLATAIDSAGQAAIKEIDRQYVTYDRDTLHGQTQGAVFP